MNSVTSIALSTYSDIVETPLDINTLIKEFQIQDVKAFQYYLSEIYKVLNKYSDDVIKGINYASFKRVNKHKFLLINFIQIFIIFSIILIYQVF